MKVLNKIFNIVDTLLRILVVFVVASLIVIVFVQVVARYVFNHSLSWTEELARILFCEMVFLTSPIVVSERKHITIDLLSQTVSKKLNRYLHLLSCIVSFIFFCFLAVSGYGLAMANMVQVTAALRWSYGMLYLGIVLSAVLMAVNVLRVGYDDFMNVYAPANAGAGKPHDSGKGAGS